MSSAGTKKGERERVRSVGDSRQLRCRVTEKVDGEDGDRMSFGSSIEVTEDKGMLTGMTKRRNFGDYPGVIDMTYWMFLKLLERSKYRTICFYEHDESQGV